ncbi:hypothetical protein BDN70DRAFT_872830 [Pholiota conissans]|uniref:CFEM domain-containing protein n=1 Tax=Pholiota conissans TaxID=109636 RepID=A0A9P5ZBB4_9AGAR|nr:hypothetical protein BDN70DRAFT_872830 [Pholiota conissans]
MRFSTVAFTLFGAAASASASTLVARQSPYPDCANPCLASADFGDCDPTDNHCLCTNSAFVSGTTTCIESSCTGADLAKAISVSQGICLSVGVTLTSSPAATSTTPTTTSPSTTPTTPAATTSGTSTGTTSTGTSTTGAPSTTTTSAAGVSRPVNALVGLFAAAVLALAL